ncbi:hypothetical protein JIW86_33830 [Streptomyces sp. NBC_00162]|nr:hypothetical protein [Streptomyces sp. NBC_00162]UUU43367.1 hypothetical protein JIW86_33830 [Streptomyces sp. NBC_00162]
MVAEHLHAHRLLPGERVIRGHHQVERFLAQHHSDGQVRLADRQPGGHRVDLAGP